MKYEERVQIKSNFTLSTADCDVLILLYAPLMGSKAYSIYMCMTSLLSRSDRVSEEYSISHFCDLYNYTPSELNNALKKLEGIGLIKRYLHVDKYIFILNPPLTAQAFLTDGVLGVYLYGTVGEETFRRIKQQFTLPKLVEKEYIDATLPFDSIYTDKVLIEQKEKLAELFGKRNAVDVIIENLEFDYTKFEKLILEEFLPKRRKEFKKCILNTAYVYAFDEFEMASIVKDSVDALGFYNMANIRKKASIKYSFIHNSAPKLRNKYAGFEDYQVLETITSVNLLDQVIQDDSKTSYFADYLKQIDELYTKLDGRFSRGVINCMIISALQNNENNLPNNSYFMKMADTWEKEYSITKIEAAVDFITNSKIEKRKTFYPGNKGKKNVKPTEEWVDKMSQNVEEGFTNL